MANFRKALAWMLMAAVAIGPSSARADMFGGDVVVLTGILSEAMSTYTKIDESFKQARVMMRTAESAYNLSTDVYNIANGMMHWNAEKTREVITGSLRETFPEGMYLYQIVKSGGVVPTYAQGQYTYQIARCARERTRMALGRNSTASGSGPGATPPPEGTATAAQPAVTEDPTCQNLINVLTMDGSARTVRAMFGVSEEEARRRVPDQYIAAVSADRVARRMAIDDLVESATQERQKVLADLLRLKGVCDGSLDLAPVASKAQALKAAFANMQDDAKSLQNQADAAAAAIDAAKKTGGNPVKAALGGLQVAQDEGAKKAALLASTTQAEADAARKQIEGAITGNQVRVEACRAAAALATTIQAVITFEMAENQREMLRLQAQQVRMQALSDARGVTGGTSDRYAQWMDASRGCVAGSASDCELASTLGKAMDTDKRVAKEQALHAGEAEEQLRREAASRVAAYWKAAGKSSGAAATLLDGAGSAANPGK